MQNTQQPATDASQSALFSLDTAELPSQAARRGIINIKHDRYLRVKIRQTPTRSRAIKHLSKSAPEWRFLCEAGIRQCVTPHKRLLNTRPYLVSIMTANMLLCRSCSDLLQFGGKQQEIAAIHSRRPCS